MQIPLDHFEDVIDEKILERGLSYFKKGHVNELEEVTPGVFETIVEGTEDYRVQVTVKNNVVTEYVCDCPYDMGPVCKHVAAVIFALQEDTLELTKPKPRKKNSSSTPKKKSLNSILKEILDKATKEELVQLIQNETKRNADFKNHILTALEHYCENLSQTHYEQQIQTILTASRGRYGYIDYQGPIVAGLAVSQLLDTASKHAATGNFQNAIDICFAVLNKMGSAVNEADDSNGNIGGCLAEACELLRHVAEKCEAVDIKKQILEYCIQKFESRELAGWDWHLDMLELAADLVDTEADFNRVVALTEEPQQSDFDEKECQLVKFRLFLKMRGEEVADSFLRENLENDRFRRTAIAKALQDKNFDYAKQLAQDGVEQDIKTKPGLAKEWYDWLLKIAQAQDDTDKIIEYARYLFIDNFRREQDYYQILKQHVKSTEWNDFVEKLIQDIENKKRWGNPDLVARIYIAEGWWNRLWEMVKNEGNLQLIEKYEGYLCKEYPKEIAELYAEKILQYLERNVGRSHYANACRYIRRINKLGERTKAEEVIATLQTKYRNRPALLEELRMV